MTIFVPAEGLCWHVLVDRCGKPKEKVSKPTDHPMCGDRTVFGSRCGCLLADESIAGECGDELSDCRSTMEQLQPPSAEETPRIESLTGQAMVHEFCGMWAQDNTQIQSYQNAGIRETGKYVEHITIIYNHHICWVCVGICFSVYVRGCMYLRVGFAIIPLGMIVVTRGSARSHDWRNTHR